MEFILVVLAIIMATLLGWLLKQSFNVQPWVAEAVDESANAAPLNAGPKLIALSTFLAVATSFFALLLSAYGLRMELGDWVPLTEPQLLWVNTAFLVAASITFQLTRNAAINGQKERLKPGMLATGVMTTAFLFGQIVAWQMLSSNGQGMLAGPANAFFYLLTIVHAIHILGGMYVWARATLRVMRGAETIAVRQSIELCTVYWHFLLLVWVVLFGFMLST